MRSTASASIAPTALPASTGATLADRLTPAAAALQVLLCANWGLGQIATKVANAGISPIFHAGLRSLGATFVLIAWIAYRRVPVWRRDGTFGAGVAIGTLFALEFVCMYIGLNYTDAARLTLLMYAAPFTVAIGAHYLVPGDRLTRVKVAGLVAAFVGLTLVFWDRLSVPDARGLVGDALALAAGVFWGATTLVVKTTSVRRTPPEKVLLYQLGVSAVVLMLGAALAGERGLFAPTPLIWAILAYQVFLVASASYLAWFWMLTRYRATTLHAFTFLTPLFGVLFAWLLLGEPITPALVAALALIAAGIVLVNRA